MDDFDNELNKSLENLKRKYEKELANIKEEFDKSEKEIKEVLIQELKEKENLKDNTTISNRKSHIFLNRAKVFTKCKLLISKYIGFLKSTSSKNVMLGVLISIVILFILYLLFFTDLILSILGKKPVPNIL